MSFITEMVDLEEARKHRELIEKIRQLESKRSSETAHSKRHPGHKNSTANKKYIKFGDGVNA